MGTLFHGFYFLGIIDRLASGWVKGLLLNWGLDFWWLVWPLVKQGKFCLSWGLGFGSWSNLWFIWRFYEVLGADVALGDLDADMTSGGAGSFCWRLGGIRWQEEKWMLESGWVFLEGVLVVHELGLTWGSGCWHGLWWSRGFCQKCGPQ